MNTPVLVIATPNNFHKNSDKLLLIYAHSFKYLFYFDLDCDS